MPFSFVNLFRSFFGVFFTFLSFPHPLWSYFTSNTLSFPSFLLSIFCFLFSIFCCFSIFYIYLSFCFIFPFLFFVILLLFSSLLKLIMLFLFLFTALLHTYPYPHINHRMPVDHLGLNIMNKTNLIKHLIIHRISGMAIKIPYPIKSFIALSVSFIKSLLPLNIQLYICI